MVYKDLVSVTLVTYNSGRFIKRCLESVLEQKYPNLEVIIVDNASTDGTVDLLEPFADRCRIYYNDKNIGFAAAQNQAIRMSSGEWVLTLNPDVLLLPNFIQALVDAGQFDSRLRQINAGTRAQLYLTAGDAVRFFGNRMQFPRDRRLCLGAGQFIVSSLGVRYHVAERDNGLRLRSPEARLGDARASLTGSVYFQGLLED